MKRVLFQTAFAALTAFVAANSWAAATTYTFSSNNYSTIANFSSCGTGPCAIYTTSLSLTGSFTLASALPPNFTGGADITSQVTAYSFSDGVNTYANTDPNSRIYQFSVVTDGSGNITIGGILLQVWQSGSSPHAVGNRVALINLNGPTINQAENNLTCTGVTNGGTASGVSDVCQFASTDASSSTASATLGTFAGGGSGGGSVGLGVATPVPTLGEWGMIFLAGLLAVFAWRRLQAA